MSIYQQITNVLTEFHYTDTSHQPGSMYAPHLLQIFMTSFHVVITSSLHYIFVWVSIAMWLHRRMLYFYGPITLPSPPCTYGCRCWMSPKEASWEEQSKTHPMWPSFASRSSFNNSDYSINIWSRMWIRVSIHSILCDEITHLHRTFSDDSVKPPLKLELGWVVISQGKFSCNH